VREVQPQDRGLDAHTACASVEDAEGVDMAEVLQHMLGQRWRDVPEAVRGGRCQGDARGGDELPGQGVVRAAHRDEAGGGCDLRRHCGLRLANNAQRARPACNCQCIEDRVLSDVKLQEPIGLAGRGDVEDARIAERPALGLEDAEHRLRIEAIGSEAVDRLRGEGHQEPPPQARGKLGEDVSGVGRPQDAGLLGCHHL